MPFRIWANHTHFWILEVVVFSRVLDIEKMDLKVKTSSVQVQRSISGSSSLFSPICVLILLIRFSFLFTNGRGFISCFSGYIEKVLVQKPIGKPFAESGDSMDRAEEAMQQDDAAHGGQTSIHLLAVLDEIRHHVLESAKLTPNKERLKKIEAKLENCRDPAFNPETTAYQRRIANLMQLQLEADTKFE